MLKQYSSVADLRADAIALDCIGGHGNSASANWCGETFAETMEYSLTGNTALVPEAEVLIAQLETHISIPRKTWLPSVAGAFPCVPDYIRGIPTSMRRRTEITSDSDPIRIFAVTTSSAGINAKILRQRGIAILALTIALSRVRPISLHALAMLDGYKDETGEIIITAEINTHPLDLATACYALTSAGFDRRLFHGIAWRLADYRGSWPKNYFNNKIEYTQKYLPQLLNPNPEQIKNTLIIPEAHLTDQLITNPVLWINTQIQRFTKELTNA